MALVQRLDPLDQTFEAGAELSNCAWARILVPKPSRNGVAGQANAELGVLALPKAASVATLQ